MKRMALSSFLFFDFCLIFGMEMYCLIYLLNNFFEIDLRTTEIDLIEQYKALTKMEAVKFTILSITLFFTSCFGDTKSSYNEVSYEGVSFKYPSYWKVKTETTKEGHFYMECEEKFIDGTIFLVSFTTFERDPKEVVNYYIEALENKFNLTKEPIHVSKFGKYDCVSIKYKMSLLRSKAYGEVYAFTTNNIAVMVVKQSEREYDLKHEKYKLIENSFIVKNADSDANTANMRRDIGRLSLHL